jgi:DNA-3-methyladenine glycosylase II
MQHAFDFLSSKDPILKNVIDSHGHPKIQLREQGFAAMVHIILEQQVSIASARATYKKLLDHLGIIAPENVLNTSDEAMRGCGISRQKTLYIKDMAAKVISGELDFAKLAEKAET